LAGAAFFLDLGESLPSSSSASLVSKGSISASSSSSCSSKSSSSLLAAFFLAADFGGFLVALAFFGEGPSSLETGTTGFDWSTS